MLGRILQLNVAVDILQHLQGIQMELVPLLPRRRERRRIGQRVLRPRYPVEVLGRGVYDEARPANVPDTAHCHTDMLILVNVGKGNGMNNLII